MMDEQKRKRIIYAAVAVLVLLVISAIVWFVFFKKNESLPPNEPITSAEESSDEAGSTPPLVQEEGKDTNVPTYKNGVAFILFDELSRYAATNSNIDLIRYYLAEQANAQSTGTVTSFTLDKSSIKETTEDGRNVLTFTTKDNTDTPYTVKLSYASSIDVYVRIYDKNNTIVQSSPYDTE